ncbi:MAG: ABC transporter permease [Anaerolineae bacterium]|nr:ABC transporter permease [Anaerolineae bacterium]
MATGTTTAPQAGGFWSRFTVNRRVLIGVFFFVLGLLVFFGASASDADTTTTLTLEAGAVEDVPHVTVPTQGFLLFTAFTMVIGGSVAVVLAGAEAPRSLKRWALLFLAFNGVLIIPAVLIAAAAGDRTNVTTMFSESLRLATPIALGAMAGLWCERSGVVNIAIEGMMLFGACFGFATLFFIQRDYPEMADNLALLLSVGVAVLSGGIVALLHAWLSITFKTDQIVSGTVINILALGVTSFVRSEFLLSSEAGTITLPTVAIPLLADLPIVGQALFNNKPIFYSMFVVILLTHLILFNTSWGLRMRAVGEHPSAADTLGINVNRTRWINVFIGGLIAGLGGAWFTLEVTGRFTDNMTSGRGFIALAALIFGKWTPLGSLGAAVLFGFSDALGVRLQALNVNIPVQFLQMVPYIVTIVVLAGLIGRALPPKAVGKPYEKE